MLPHEIELVESMETLGERVTWIPRAPYVPGQGRLPTNDFIWVTNGGIAIELKATSDSYGKIRRLVQPAIQRAAEQGVVKDVFVIDIGPYRLRPKLRVQLEQYNLRHPDWPITRLRVMGGGELTEIHLPAQQEAGVRSARSDGPLFRGLHGAARLRRGGCCLGRPGPLPAQLPPTRGGGSRLQRALALTVTASAYARRRDACIVGRQAGTMWPWHCQRSC